MKTSVSVKAIRAALICVPKKDVRYYLHGVLVESDDAGAMLVSTDGHRLHACRCYDAATIPGSPFIVPRDMLETIARSADKLAMVNISNDNGALTLERSDGLTITGAPIDATFPDIRRVVPGLTFSSEPAQFNPAFIVDAEKAAALMADYAKKPAIHIRHNGNNPAIIVSQDSPNFLAVVMPMRSKDSAESNNAHAYLKPDLHTIPAAQAA